MSKAKGTFEIYLDKSGEYRWRLLTETGENIASSGDGFKTLEECQEQVAMVREYSAEGSGGNQQRNERMPDFDEEDYNLFGGETLEDLPEGTYVITEDKVLYETPEEMHTLAQECEHPDCTNPDGSCSRPKEVNVAEANEKKK